MSSIFSKKISSPKLSSKKADKMPVRKAIHKKPEKTGLGDEPLYQPKDGEAKVDIVFVHGIGGDRINTWTYEARKAADNKLWPRDFLPEVLPQARIVSFGYNADPAKFFIEDRKHIAPELTVDNYSTSLLEDVRAMRNEDKDRPIIFVAHSMGGLVVTNALAKAHNKSEEALKSISDQIIGLLFLGTPFQVSALASYSSIALNILSFFTTTQGASVELLEKKSKRLADINKNFATFLKKRYESHDMPRFEIACFFEARPISGDMLVVPQASATWLGVDGISIDADHREMARFDSKYSMGFRSVASKLKKWVEEYDKNKTSGGVGGLRGASINLLGNVDYSGASFFQSLPAGHIASTERNGVNIVFAPGEGDLATAKEFFQTRPSGK